MSKRTFVKKPYDVITPTGHEMSEDKHKETTEYKSVGKMEKVQPKQEVEPDYEHSDYKPKKIKYGQRDIEV